MNSTITLLYWESLGASELNVIKLVEFLGGSVRTVRLTGEVSQLPDGLETLGSSCRCLITSARTLANFRNEPRGTMRRQLRLADLAEKTFIYGFEPGAGDAEFLRELTAGALVDVKVSPAANQRINVATEPICRQLSGLSFEAPGTDPQHTFVHGSVHDACTRVISFGENPFYVRMQKDRCEAFLLAGGQVADLDTVAIPGTSVLDFFVGLAPLLMFLYGSLREYLWHNDSPTACFIVDDPLLKKRYGCLDFEKLLELMDRKRFSTSIAFIPWNYRRSQRGVVNSFKRRPISLSVHGCDHTDHEFASDDPVLLRQKARQALERMSKHRSLSGLDFDDVMVFPQGKFSTTAMSALKSCGYLAAVNSTVYPVDPIADLMLRDLLQVVVTRYSNFPLFNRWYPRQFAELAFNLFLGKPALLVEHHGFFREGYTALAETIEKVHGLEPRLRWANLGSICSRTCWKRIGEDGEIHVLFFTDRFALQNETDAPQRYVLTRHGLLQPGAAVTVNGRRVEVSRDSTAIKVQLNAGETAEIRIGVQQPEVLIPGPAPRPMYQVRVFIRRSLSEFRDNYLDLYPFVSRAVRNR